VVSAESRAASAEDDQPMREGDYMLACWKHKHAKTPLDQLAKDMKLSIHFLSNWWNLVNSVEPKSRYLDLVRVPWRELPADEKTAHERIKAIEADLLSWNNPEHPGSGAQRQQQDADGIRRYQHSGHREGQGTVPSLYWRRWRREQRRHRDRLANRTTHRQRQTQLLPLGRHTGSRSCEKTRW